jgi:hypothetical protein
LPGASSLAEVSQFNQDTTKAQTGGTLITVKSDGSFETTIQVDPLWLVGSSHVLVATEQSSGQKASLTIVIPHPAKLVSCASSAATTSIVLGPVPEGQAQPVSTAIALCTTGSGQVLWTASWNKQQVKWLQVDQSGSIQAPLSKQLTISASATGLKAGSYNAIVTFSDQNSLTKVTLKVTFIVRSRQATACLNTSTQSLSYTAKQGLASPAAQMVTLTNCGSSGSWTATSHTDDGANWLSVNPGSGSLASNASQNVSIAAASAHLQAGTYTGQVTFKMGSSSQTVSVAFTILQQQQKPCLSLNTQSLPFTAIQGQGDPAPQTVTLTNCGSAGSWSASTANGSSWLTISPAGNTLNAGATQSVTVSVSISGLNPGTYSDTITFTITTSNGTNQTTMAIALTVQSPPPPCIQVNPGALTFTGTQGQSDPAAQTITLTNCGPTGSWTAATASGSGWLNFNLASNTLNAGATQNVAVNASLAGLKAGTYSDTITFTMTNGTGTNQQTVAVTFIVQSPPCLQIASIKPSPSPNDGIVYVYAGSTITVVVTNCGSDTGTLSSADSVRWLSDNLPSNTTITSGGNQTITITPSSTAPPGATGTETITLTTSGGQASVTISVGILYPIG